MNYETFCKMYQIHQNFNKSKHYVAVYDLTIRGWRTSSPMFSTSGEADTFRKKMWQQIYANPAMMEKDQVTKQEVADDKKKPGQRDYTALSAALLYLLDSQPNKIWVGTMTELYYVLEEAGHTKDVLGPNSNTLGARLRIIKDDLTKAGFAFKNDVFSSQFGGIKSMVIYPVDAEQPANHALSKYREVVRSGKHQPPGRMPGDFSGRHGGRRTSAMTKKNKKQEVIPPVTGSINAPEQPTSAVQDVVQPEYVTIKVNANILKNLMGILTGTHPIKIVIDEE